MLEIRFLIIKEGRKLVSEKLPELDELQFSHTGSPNMILASFSKVSLL